MRRYILNAAGDPAPCEDLLEWARWYEERDNRRVALDEVNGVRVSTVFLGLDHGWGRGAPALWETMSVPREDTPPAEGNNAKITPPFPGDWNGAVKWSTGYFGPTHWVKEKRR
jgi:hypothetical protein